MAWEPAKIKVVTVSIPTFATVFASTMVTVVLLCAALVALGVLLSVIGVRLVRATRTDPEALGALELMGDRRWRRGDAELRAEVLAGASPPATEADAAAAADAAVIESPSVDETGEVVDALPEASSLSEPGLPDPQPPQPTPPPSPPTPPSPPIPVPQPEPVPPEPLPPVPGPPPEPVPEPIPHPPVPDPLPSPFPPQPIPPPPIPQVESSAEENEEARQA